MYDCLDQPVANLVPAERIIIWGMRQWVRAATARRCPITVIAPAFSHLGSVAAAQHLSMTMAILNRHAMLSLHFGCPCAATVNDDEAVILGFIRQAGNEPHSHLVSGLMRLVEDDKADMLAAAMHRLTATLADAQLR